MFKKKDPLQIVPFQSYGTDSHLYIRGRALEDENIDLSKRGFFSLIRNTYKRFEADEIPYAKLKLKLGDDSFYYVETGSDGYFKLKLDLANLNTLTNKEGWLNYSISFDQNYPDRIIQNDNKFGGEMLIPSIDSSFGVISDIDDTILHTGVVSTFKWRLIFNTLFRNAESRSPLEGAPHFYHLLHRGPNGKEANPIFYVSHSPWNLYRYLELFLTKNKFPKGPILLRTLTAFKGRKANSEKPQKQKEIVNLLKTYPEKQFILIGDSGEHDADIYIEVAEAYPNRIKAIFLRSVRHKKRMLRVKGLIDNYKTVPAFLVESSKEAIDYAIKEGLILPELVP